MNGVGSKITGSHLQAKTDSSLEAHQQVAGKGLAGLQLFQSLGRVSDTTR